MNRYACVLALVLILLTSGCTEGGDIFSLFGLDLTPGEPVYIKAENLKLKVEVVPYEIYEGQSTTLFFDLSNDGNMTVTDINVEMTDIGDFSAQETSRQVVELEDGEMESWNWKLDSGGIDIFDEKIYSFRYKIDYKSSSSSMYDIVAMSEDEYTRLERQGTLEKEINLSYFKTKAPVEIDLSISKTQPLFEGLDFYLYVELNDFGGGKVNQIGSGELYVYYPDFLEFVESSDFTNESTPQGNRLVLSRPLEFLNKETKKATCKFMVKSVGVRDIGQFKAETSYIYINYKTINVKVKPK